MVCGPAVTVVTFPAVTRFTHFTADCSIACPCITADTICHSPSNSVVMETDGFDSWLTGGSWSVCANASPPRFSVSKTNPLPAGAANEDGRTFPRVARQIFQE